MRYFKKSHARQRLNGSLSQNLNYLNLRNCSAVLTKRHYGIGKYVEGRCNKNCHKNCAPRPPSITQEAGHVRLETIFLSVFVFEGAQARSLRISNLCAKLPAGLSVVFSTQVFAATYNITPYSMRVVSVIKL